ncbi:hypothetical protein [Ornithinimicrobium sp. W1665]|uniref:hypothetical protein n=1 Tax=Ornithinimicrobium sp. W1665 TaxID=3416666 RepID=UPI003CEC23B1
MRTTTRTRWAALLSAGALSFSLVACAGGDAGDDAADEGTTAPAAGTEDASADTAAPTGGSDDAQTSAPAADGGDGEHAEGEEVPVEEFLAMLRSPGEEVMSTYELQMVVTTGSQTMEMAGEVDLGGEQPALDAELTMPGLGATRMIVVDGSAFVSMPGVTEEGTFVEVPQDQLAETGAGLEDIDISSTWDAWDEGAGRVVFVGTEDVDGTDLRRYEVVVDTDAALDASGQTGPDAAEASAMMGEEITYDVWVDEEDLLRRISFATAGSVTEMTVDRWGEEMDIEAPAEEDVQPMPTGTSGG